MMVFTEETQEEPQGGWQESRVSAGDCEKEALISHGPLQPLALWPLPPTQPSHSQSHTGLQLVDQSATVSLV